MLRFPHDENSVRLCDRRPGHGAHVGPGSEPSAAVPADLHVGDPAPAFSLPGSDGKVHKLSDYKGKTVVLAWFPKAFTGG